MSGQHAAFVGSIPENYDRYLGPLLFEPYAADIADRFQLREGGAVLEIACGTGIVTRRLREKLPSSVRLVATDLNDAMLNYAREKTGPAELLEWKQADATELPFDDSSFDAVVCQFGLMFFPDKSKALREVARVLVPGGVFAFNVWDTLETNELALIAHQKIGSLFPHDPPGFYKVPFSLHDKAAVEKLLSDAGFSEAQITTLHAECVGHPANETAMGLVQGNPVMVEINQRGTPSVAEVTEAVASELRSRFGEDPIPSKMQAIVFVART